MKALHRKDLFGWSSFDLSRNLDFNALLWVRGEGNANVAIDPLPLTAHDEAHLRSLGGVGWVLVSNADHTRAATSFARDFGAKIVGPAGDKEFKEFEGMDVMQWAEAGEELGCGIRCVAMRGSKTPGELAFVLPPGDSVWVGDLVRCHRAGWLQLLPDAKLKDKEAALAAVRELAALPGLDAVLLGDGYSAFRDGVARLREIPGVGG
jgi:glyoxylase-like metal-dependent hydrolase (beta-lactamase superfamily II)